MGTTQEKVPDCLKLTYQECIEQARGRRLREARTGVEGVEPEEKGQVVDTSPPANSMATITNEITVFVGSGPGTAPVPPVANQTGTSPTRSSGVEVHQSHPGPRRQPLPAGQVVGTASARRYGHFIGRPDSGAGLQGQSDRLPDFTGKFYTDVVPYLQGLGFLRTPLNGGDVPGQDKDRNRVVRQDPPQGTGVNKDGTITLYFGS